MKVITVVINLPNGKEVHREWRGVSLDYLWMAIRDEFPEVTSVVMTFTTPEGELRPL